jgi:hypothetical protein
MREEHDNPSSISLDLIGTVIVARVVSVHSGRRTEEQRKWWQQQILLKLRPHRRPSKLIDRASITA